MRADRVHRLQHDGVIISKRLMAVFTLYFLAMVLRVNSEFFMAPRTFQVVTFRGRSNNHSKLRKRNKHGHFDAVFCQFSIQKCSAGATVHQSRRHIIATLGTRATGPCAVHGLVLISDKVWRQLFMPAVNDSPAPAS